MNRLINEFLAPFRNSYRIFVKNGGIGTLCRDQSTVSNYRSWPLKHDSAEFSQALTRIVQTSYLFSTGYLTHRGCLTETKKLLLSGSVTSSHLLKLCFNSETRSFSTLPTVAILNGGGLNYHTPRRFRHRSVKTGDSSKEKIEETEPENEDDENNEDKDDDDDLSHLTFPEDIGFPDNFKELKVHLKSVRLDAVVSAGLNTARNKVDDYFLESKLRLNGERVLKKSKQMKTGDFVDLIMSAVDGKMRVKRVRVLKVDENKTSKDKLKVTVRAWRTAVPVEC